MDNEAQALAKRSALNTDDQPPRKRRKKLSSTAAAAVTDPEVDHVTEQYKRFCRELRAKFFPGSPSIKDVEANNRDLRAHVSGRMAAVDDAQTRLRSFLPRTGSNETGEVVVRDGVLLPPGSKYIQRWGGLSNGFLDLPSNYHPLLTKLC